MPRRIENHTATRKWLHWLVAFFLLSLMSAAYGFAFVPRAERATAIPVHVSLGLVVLALTLVRVAYRKVVPPPALPETTPKWVVTGSKLGHALLYGLFFYLAIIGLWMAAASEVDIRLFGGLNVSALAPTNVELVEALRPWHLAGSIAFGVLLCVHIIAAFYHQFVLRDDILLRILPFSGLIRRGLRSDDIVTWRFPSKNKIDWHDRRTWFKEN
jgi:superoxide oxidase